MENNSLRVGEYQTLQIAREAPPGLYLTDGTTEVLLPYRYAPEGWAVEQPLRVFVYRDSEDRLVATTETPYATVGQCAYLEVVGISSAGAFVDWGLTKDLLVPRREQSHRMLDGMYYPVFVYHDDRTDRVVGSCRLHRFVRNDELTVAADDQVELLLTDRTDLGYNAVVNDCHWGLLYASDVFGQVEVGDRLMGYVRTVREDNKLDVALRPAGYEAVTGAAAQLLHALENADGFLPLTDKSAPEDVYERLSMSKKVFKKALGQLYRERLVTLEETGIRRSK